MNIDKLNNRMKSLINEDFVKKQSFLDETFDVIESLIGEDYPASWDKEYFKTLNSFASRIRYCEEHLQRISSGSSRIAYKIDNEKVLKLAKNKKGLAQNEVEVGASLDTYHNFLFAKVFDYDASDLWLEMELARKLKKKDFKRIKGYSFDEYSMGLNYFYHTNVRPRRFNPTKPSEEIMETLWEDPFYSTMCEYMKNYDAPVGDLIRTSSYGIVIRDGEDDVVLIDYGLTSTVYDTYYS